MKNPLIYLLPWWLLAGCAPVQKPAPAPVPEPTPEPTAEESSLNEFESLALRAEYFASALATQPEKLLGQVLADKCAENRECLRDNLLRMNQAVKKTLKNAQLSNTLLFEVQNIKYFDDRDDVEVLLFASDGHRRRKGVAFMFKMRPAGAEWKLDISNYAR